jgi:hypothetical protein
MTTLIVARGETTEFYKFLAVTAKANRETIIIDRRRTNTRRLDQYGAVRDRRRSTDRRRPQPSSWERDRVIVVETASVEGTRG